MLHKSRPSINFQKGTEYIRCDSYNSVQQFLKKQITWETIKFNNKFADVNN